MPYPFIVFRRTYRRGRKHWLRRGLNTWYELKIEDGPIEAMPVPDLMPRISRVFPVHTVDLGTCEMAARELYDSGDDKTWVFFPTGGSVTDEEVTRSKSSQ